MTILALVANHLWQSTLFAALAGLGTLAFRRNRAAVRHAIWLAASIKFLVPFAALVALGGALGLRAAAPTRIVERNVSIVLAGGEPFPFWGLDLAAPLPLVDTTPSLLATLIPAGLAIWMLGTVAILTVWIVRWRRVAALARAGAPVVDGPHVEALRDIERRAGRGRPLAVVASDAPLEPGVFGIVRPVLVWPAAIVNQLTPDQIAAILAHEVSHVRRRDNLAAVIHMAVQALFWFHPMVWWIGARLVDERERACDEDVLQAGSEPEVYAATILQACRLYLESPLACVSGVTGSDLTRRIEHIMTSGPAQALSRGRKLLLASCAVAAVAAPIALGAASPPSPLRIDRFERRARAIARVNQGLHVSAQDIAALPRFEVASIKPNRSGGGPVRIQTSPGGRFTAVNMTLKGLVLFAYRLQSFQLSGGPDWFNSDRFDIVAKGDETDDGNEFRSGQSTQSSRMQLMLRALLADRFQLVVRSEPREQPMYALIVARPDGRLGSDLRRSTLDCANNPPVDAAGVNKAQPVSASGIPCGIRMGMGTLAMGGATMLQLASTLSGLLDRSVVDRTQLAGAFDASLKWTPDESTPGLQLKSKFVPPGDPNGPSIFTAVQEQLGLKLDSQKGPVSILIVDRAERPIEN